MTYNPIIVTDNQLVKRLNIKKLKKNYFYLMLISNRRQVMTIEQVKSYLKKNKITYQELSDKSGIPIGTLKNIFSKCAINPRLDTMQSIEKALGLNQPSLEWTEADQAQGIGRYPTYLSEAETEWLELRSEILRIHGEQYLETVITMLKALTKTQN